MATAAPPRQRQPRSEFQQAMATERLSDRFRGIVFDPSVLRNVEWSKVTISAQDAITAASFIFEPNNFLQLDQVIRDSGYTGDSAFVAMDHFAALTVYALWRRDQDLDSNGDRAKHSDSVVTGVLRNPNHRHLVLPPFDYQRTAPNPAANDEEAWKFAGGARWAWMRAMYAENERDRARLLRISQCLGQEAIWQGSAQLRSSLLRREPKVFQESIAILATYDYLRSGVGQFRDYVPKRGVNDFLDSEFVDAFFHQVRFSFHDDWAEEWKRLATTTQDVPYGGRPRPEAFTELRAHRFSSDSPAANLLTMAKVAVVGLGKGVLGRPPKGKPVSRFEGRCRAIWSAAVSVVILYALHSFHLETGALPLVGSVAASGLVEAKRVKRTIADGWGVVARHRQAKEEERQRAAEQSLDKETPPQEPEVGGDGVNRGATRTSMDDLLGSRGGAEPTSPHRGQGATGPAEPPRPGATTAAPPPYTPPPGRPGAGAAPNESRVDFGRSGYFPTRDDRHRPSDSSSRPTGPTAQPGPSPAAHAAPRPQRPGPTEQPDWRDPRGPRPSPDAPMPPQGSPRPTASPPGSTPPPRPSPAAPGFRNSASPGSTWTDPVSELASRIGVPSEGLKAQLDGAFKRPNRAAEILLALNPSKADRDELFSLLKSPDEDLGLEIENLFDRLLSEPGAEVAIYTDSGRSRNRPGGNQPRDLGFD
jgi:hypothetical protein